MQVVESHLLAGLRDGERGAEALCLFEEGRLLRELLLEHLRRPAVVVLEVEVGGVRVAGFFQRVIDRIDVGFEIKVVFEHATCEEAGAFGGERAGFVGR